MSNQTKDERVLHHIQRLAAEEHQLFAKETLDDTDRHRLAEVNVELDQCWDLLRQRQALRDAKRSPDLARVRSPNVVENYLQ